MYNTTLQVFQAVSNSNNNINNNNNNNNNNNSSSNNNNTAPENQGATTNSVSGRTNNNVFPDTGKNEIIDLANSDHGQAITASAPAHNQPGGVRNTDRQQISSPPSYEAYHNYANYEPPSYQSIVPSVTPVDA